MVVTRLAFESFRNLRDGEIFPCPGVNVVYGDNAQGKTNLLEGLWLFTGGHSFRGAKDVELPRLDPKTGENAPAAALALDFFSEGRDQKAILRLENGRRSSVINGVKKKTGSALVGKVCAVIFSPEHLLLVKEGPARRRGFLDGALCQLRPSYAGMLHVYQRALAQRNALLKDIVRFPELHDTLSVWDATAVVGNIHHVSGQQAHLDLVAEACQGFVDGVVHDLIHQVVKAPGACRADVHTRALAHCLQAFQHLDLVAVIGFFRLCHVGHFVNFQARTLL